MPQERGDEAGDIHSPTTLESCSTACLLRILSCPFSTIDEGQRQERVALVKNVLYAKDHCQGILLIRHPSLKATTYPVHSAPVCMFLRRFDYPILQFSAVWSIQLFFSTCVEACGTIADEGRFTPSGDSLRKGSAVY